MITAARVSLRRLLFGGGCCLVAVEEEAVEEEADEGAEEDTEGIGGEVKPVAIAVAAGAVGLQEFEESAHEDG